MEVVKLSQKAINRAIDVIRSGGVVIFPTDTVYGFLADATNEKAVEKIYKIKERPRSKPLPVFVKDFKMAKELAEINDEQEKIIKEKWPGGYTFVLNREKTPIYGVEKYTIALRIPKYEFLNDLLEKINKPLVQTSVNISGQEAISKISEIKKVFEDRDVLIVEAGDLPKNTPSTIIDLTKNKIEIIR